MEDVKAELERLASAFTLSTSRLPDHTADDADEDDEMWGRATNTRAGASPEIASVFGEISRFASEDFKPPRQLISVNGTRKVTDLHAFWQSVSHRYPLLSKFAIAVQTIPATEATCERVFSVAGAILKRHGYNTRDRVLKARLLIQTNYRFANYAKPSTFDLST